MTTRGFGPVRFHGTAGPSVAADRAGPDPGGEILDDGEVHVGLEQRHAHLAQGGIDLRLAEHAAPGEFLEYFLQAIGQGFKHVGPRKRVGILSASRNAVKQGKGLSRITRMNTGYTEPNHGLYFKSCRAIRGF
jgi:hypothetical protein